MSETQIAPMKAAYSAVVHDEAEGGFWAEVPELPGCFTQSDTLDALYRDLIEAITCHLDVEMASVRVGFLEMAVV